MRIVLLAPLLAIALAACGRAGPPAPESAGNRLEAAAEAAGLVADPNGSLVGAWSRDTDRVCVAPAADGTTRIGALVDYGEGQACAASGSVERSGSKLRVTFGDCAFDATFDGDRIAFPADMPEACEAKCAGRASLAALSVERQGASASEAATLRAPDGRLLCAP